ncbi:uncharacterized protein LOC133184830 [Saccostrea echinata]|uniref:uncharacterized protein LOC133184830 n=1 Tax=Saccostrea echinata TaxID=191078 RepID=UPI002A8251E4|nr:uncharacterized protein LOC133184830 [Saccostrea echinata]
MGNVTLGGFCSSKEQCTGSLHADVCKNKRCICKSGYISYNLTCYRGNLKINETCERNEQCTAASNSECQNGTCMCRDGHIPVNETDCKQVERNKNTEKKTVHQVQANGFGATTGGVFGGFFLGVLFSVLVAYLISKRYMANMKKRDENNVKFDRHSANLAPTTEDNRSQTAKNTEQNLQRKVVNVPPYAPSMESPTYSNVLKAKTSQMKKDDVYSHLHEKENQETENVYNHASGSSGKTMEDDYSHLNAGRGNDRVVLPEDDEYAHTEAVNNDNYFILENQSDIN